jgi:hypothetical protein
MKKSLVVYIQFFRNLYIAFPIHEDSTALMLLLNDSHVLKNIKIKNVCMIVKLIKRKKISWENV